MVVFIGLILLVGIVVNNAIVLVDRVNELRRQHGLAKDAALKGRSAAITTHFNDHADYRPRALAYGPWIWRCRRTPHANGSNGDWWSVGINALNTGTDTVAYKLMDRSQ